MLESFLIRPEVLTDDDVMDILKQAFSQTGMKEVVAESVKCRVTGNPYGVRAQLYTGRAGALRPAGASCGKRMISSTLATASNHHRGRCASCAGCASYPLDLPPGNTLRCKLFPSSKFYNFMTSKMESLLDISDGCDILKTRKANFPLERRFA